MAIEANVEVISARLLAFGKATIVVQKVYLDFMSVRAKDKAVGRTMSGPDKALYLAAANTADSDLDDARTAYETARDATTPIEP